MKRWFYWLMMYLGLAVAGAGVIVNLVPIFLKSKNGDPLSINDAHDLCSSSLGIWARGMDPTVASKCSEYNTIYNLSVALVILGFVIAIISLWVALNTPREQKHCTSQFGPDLGIEYQCLHKADGHIWHHDQFDNEWRTSSR